MRPGGGGSVAYIGLGWVCWRGWKPSQVDGFEVGWRDGQGEHRLPLADARSVPFEDGRPVRSFPSYRGQRHFPGLYRSSTTCGHVGFESWLERDHAMLLDFTPEVTGLLPHLQRTRIGELRGQIRDLQAEWTEEAVQRITTENTTLKQRVRQLTSDNRTLDERLEAARSNLRFQDRRVADLEAQIADPSAELSSDIDSSDRAHLTVTLARWLGHSSPVITLGYYSHFMPEAGSKGRGTIDGLLGERGARLASGNSPDLPRAVDR